MSKTEMAYKEEELNFDNSHNKGQVFYSPSEDKLVVVNSKGHVYFEADMLYKIYGSNNKRIKTYRGCGFNLIQNGYRYLGGL